ncbi:MCE family protein [Nocardioides sp. NPDC101246]|uniref:MCE family protein n=1 Tax=Nocardioides sp. NPDC101246 TaxID=3364336 RepID=UPI0037F707B5
MSNEFETNRTMTQLMGLAGLVVILTVCGILIATYLKVFADTVPVTVASDRAGLLLDKGARVRLSGVAVGEVRDTKLGDDGNVEIELAIDGDKVDQVPANVLASIKGTTVFGSKFIDLSLPDVPAEQAISAGDTINANEVTIEVNDVFERGLEVLSAVDPATLNTTLASISTALRGRGNEFGQFFTEWNAYLKRMEPHLDALEYVLETSPAVLGTYSAAAPALIDSADNLATTSHTLVANGDEFTGLLAGAVDGADAARKFLLAVEAPLRAFNREWLPVTGLAKKYVPEYDCVIKGLDEHRKVFNNFFGHENPDEFYFYASVGFLPGQEKYSMKKYAPKLIEGGGPACYPLATKKNPTPPRVRFDDGSLGIYSDEQTDKLAHPGEQPINLYGDLLADWLGKDGKKAFLEGIEK